MFDTDFDAIQLNVQHGASPTLVNAGNAKILGWELQAESLVGNTGLQLNGSAAFLDAYYTYVNPAANIPETALPDGTTICPGGQAAGCTISLGGSPLEAKLPKTPRWKFTFDPVYTI